MSLSPRVARRSAAILTLSVALCAASPSAASRDFLIPARVRPSPLDQLTDDGRPTPAAIALLRSHARGRMVRLWADGARHQGADARFDSLGVTWAAESAPSDSSLPSLAWAEIDRLETRRSGVLRGVLLGAFVGAVAMLATADKAGPDPGPGIIIVLAFPPAGAVVGGLVGSATPRWQREWPPERRPPTAGP